MLMYPDAYEVGLPNQGVQILYEILNERDGVLAERTYSVWHDMEAVMREHHIPQFARRRPPPGPGLRRVRALLLHRARLHQHAHRARPRGDPAAREDRTDDDPIVLAGGHAAFNPEPVADFVDAVVLGDGEEIVLAITEVVREWKAEGRPGGRDEVLLRLAASGGVYVPRFYDVAYDTDGSLVGSAQPARRTRPGAQAHPDGPRRLALPAQPAGAPRGDRARAVQRGDLPWLHPRLQFQAGMITRRVRERSISTIGDMVENGIRKSGFEEVGLLSLSSADHSEIGEVAKGLADRVPVGTNVSLSLPSARSTPSTSPSPTSSRATAGARG